MVKRKLIKDAFVSIKKSNKRFLSILLIVLLGVGFFTGIKSTSPDMKDTLNKYYEDTNFMDFSLISTWGISNDDISYLKSKGYNVVGAYSFDVIVKDEVEEAVKVLSYDKDSKINKLVLVEGRLPENDNECVVEYALLSKNNRINDEILIDNEYMKNKKLTIVGTIKSPVYVSNERGNTKLLNGKLSYFLYVPITNFDSKYYTEANIALEEDYYYYSDEYNELINKENKKLEYYTNKLKDNRFEDAKADALNDYNDALNTYNLNKTDAINKLDEYKKALDAGKVELDSNEKLLNDAYLEFESKKTELNKNIDDLLNNKSLITTNLNTLNTNITLQEENKSKIKDLINNGVNVEENTILLNNLEDTLKTMYESKTELENNIEVINKNINKINDGIDSTSLELSNKSDELSLAKEELDSKYKEYEKTKKETFNELYKGEIKLIDAKEAIDELEKPTWYVLDRGSNTGAYQYSEDSLRIDNISKLFPLIFFIVAILICLTSMTRMVEEERTSLGTLKSLGYTNKDIILKYVIYALSATIIGSIIGSIICSSIIPKIIINMYTMMYSVGNTVTSFNIKYALIGTLAAVFCTLAATLYVLKKELKSVPAELLRPKSPKSGKRVLLERIKFIWNKLSFSRKVTIRNVFRYKKRFLMTIIGIMGCTGLIVAGFGLKDCITDTVPSQYGNIFTYEVEVTLKDNISVEALNSAKEEINNIDKVKDTLALNKESINIANIDTTQNVILVVPFDDTDGFIKINDYKTKKQLELSDDVIVTEKIMNLLDLNVGDTLILSNDKTYKVKIGAIAENYIYHYIYMNKDFYDSDKFNTILIKTDNLTNEEEKILAEELKNIDAVSNISFTSSMKNIFDSSMKNFGYVVWVLIVSAGLLAFVVLYNLASVNISERKRELATIKVLGFYDKEVYNYVGRETVILTFIGIAFGLLIGKMLTVFIIKTCEIDMLIFSTNVHLLSYIYSIIITVVFTILVNITTYFSLKKIDMIESLKSVE